MPRRSRLPSACHGLFVFHFGSYPRAEQSGRVVGHLAVGQVTGVGADCAGRGLRDDGVGLAAMGECGGHGGHLCDAARAAFDGLEDAFRAAGEVVDLERDGDAANPLVAGCFGE